jgi:hypothetical protein
MRIFGGNLKIVKEGLVMKKFKLVFSPIEGEPERTFKRYWTKKALQQAYETMLAKSNGWNIDKFRKVLPNMKGSEADRALRKAGF